MVYNIITPPSGGFYGLLMKPQLDTLATCRFELTLTYNWPLQGILKLNSPVLRQVYQTGVINRTRVTLGSVSIQSSGASLPRPLHMSLPFSDQLNDITFICNSAYCTIPNNAVLHNNMRLFRTVKTSRHTRYTNTNSRKIGSPLPTVRNVC